VFRSSHHSALASRLSIAALSPGAFLGFMIISLGFFRFPLSALTFL